LENGAALVRGRVARCLFAVCVDRMDTRGPIDCSANTIRSGGLALKRRCFGPERGYGLAVAITPWPCASTTRTPAVP
jgi:hypothetical protein